jgi:hypothetical protein
LLPTPLMDAQVALAVPAPLSAVMAKPDATAPTSTVPGSLLFEVALCRPIGCPSFAGLLTDTCTVVPVGRIRGGIQQNCAKGNLP